MSWRAELFSSDRPSQIRSFVGAIPSNVMTQVTCWMISWKKSYLRVFGLGNFLNFLECSRLIRRKRLPRFSKRQVSESLFDLKDPKRFQRWLNVPSFPNILQTLQDIADMMMKLNPHQSWADKSMDSCHWGREVVSRTDLESLQNSYCIKFISLPLEISHIDQNLD